MKCEFFWRPERLRLSDDVDWHERELFLDARESPDENSTCSIELVRVVIPELLDPSRLAKAPHTFFWRRTWNPETGELSELPAVPEGEPMEQDAPAAAPAGAPAGEPAAARARAPRRNAALERVADLEAKWSELTSSLIEQCAAPPCHAARAALAVIAARPAPSSHELLVVRRNSILTARVAELEAKLDAQDEKAASKSTVTALVARVATLELRVTELESSVHFAP